MNVEIPPAQDSPKHILNALNDDCIQFILRRLKNASDFLSAAETCVRFQENAIHISRTPFKEIRIDNSSLSKSMSADRMQRFLSIFGHLVMEIDFDRRQLKKNVADKIHNMIAEYCGKTLKTLKLASNNTVVDFKTSPPFEALEELQLDDTHIKNFEHQAQLRRLYIFQLKWRKRYLDWLRQVFPKLEWAKFELVDQLEHSELIGFLELNLQLKSLEIKYCEQLEAYALENIANFAPNLEHFTFRGFYSNSFNYPTASQIGNLSKLKYLNIGIHSESLVKQIIASLIENNVQIETLYIVFEFGLSLFELNMSHLKSLKNLRVHIDKGETLVHLVQSLPQLQKIIVDAACTGITLNDIQEALQYSKHLSVFTVKVYKISINLNEFNSILNLAKLANVQVIIDVLVDTKVDVPMDLLNENRKWLDIKKIFLNQI